ncbi:hypothetical protein CKO_03640 [Citrobacter koseri ATCC BAA-895]|uniref:Uncharacterized protein n=1 Tax=Citrobacter koseri (strain ATCC BAA-895 / CDC 4225-83 / SGSC4696) TaxID=290338 RepID=A8AMK7_CITK8|nr:hypothetical protein CKO_03640 [Citrobacter koseri ATCC BAA-895]
MLASAFRRMDLFSASESRNFMLRPYFRSFGKCSLITSISFGPKSAAESILRTPTTYLLPETVISLATCVEAIMMSAPFSSLLYSPTAQLFTVCATPCCVRNWSTFIFMIIELPCPQPQTARIRTVIIGTPY